MPDERTNSDITWFNSPLRGNQNAQTLIDMIQVGQWYGQHEVSFHFFTVDILNDTNITTLASSERQEHYKCKIPASCQVP